MIKIYIDEYNNISKWYCQQILTYIKAKKDKAITILSNFANQNLKEQKRIAYTKNVLTNLNDEEIVNILTKPIDYLVENYKPIKKYVKLIKFFILNKKKLKTRNVSFVNHINKSLSQMFNYSFITASIRTELVNKLNIKVCPYCNRQYIQPITIKGKRKYYCDLDHILPKSMYPLFSMSLWNLLPTCKPCNQAFKRSDCKDLLSPYTDGFDNDIILKIKYKTLKSIVGLDENFEFKWTIQDTTNEQKKILAQNNIDLFCLNEIYKTHIKEFSRIIRKKYNFSNAYQKSLKRFYKLETLLNLSFLLKDMLYYGINLSNNDFQNELLSKAIYDIINNN